MPVTILEADPRVRRRHRPHGEVQGLSTSTSAAIASSRSRRKSRTSGPRYCPTTCSIGRARRASSTAASSSPIRSRPAKRCASSACSNRRAACSRTARLASFPVKDPKNFEDWVTQPVRQAALQHLLQDLHGKGLGHGCKEISADWAAQRIKGLSLGSRDRNALLPKKQPKDKSKVIKTLIDTFRYPRRGPGHDVGGLRRQDHARWAATIRHGHEGRRLPLRRRRLSSGRSTYQEPRTQDAAPSNPST